MANQVYPLQGARTVTYEGLVSAAVDPAVAADADTGKEYVLEYVQWQTVVAETGKYIDIDIEGGTQLFRIYAEANQCGEAHPEKRLGKDKDLDISTDMSTGKIKVFIRLRVEGA